LPASFRALRVEQQVERLVLDIDREPLVDRLDQRACVRRRASARSGEASARIAASVCRSSAPAVFHHSTTAKAARRRRRPR
jgi:hypothetical protein